MTRFRSPPITFQTQFRRSPRNFLNVGTKIAHPVCIGAHRCTLAEINVAVHRVNCVYVYRWEGIRWWKRWRKREGEKERENRGEEGKRDREKESEKKREDGGEARKVYIHHFVFLADIKIYTIVQTAHPPSAAPPRPFNRPTFRHPPASSKPTPPTTSRPRTPAAGAKAWLHQAATSLFYSTVGGVQISYLLYDGSAYPKLTPPVSSPYQTLPSYCIPLFPTAVSFSFHLSLFQPFLYLSISFHLSVRSSFSHRSPRSSFHARKSSLLLRVSSLCIPCHLSTSSCYGTHSVACRTFGECFFRFFMTRRSCSARAKGCLRGVASSNTNGVSFPLPQAEARFVTGYRLKTGIKSSRAGLSTRLVFSPSLAARSPLLTVVAERDNCE